MAIIGLISTSPSRSLQTQPLPDCFWRPLGDIPSGNLKYKITKTWNSTELIQLQSGALNTSDYIHVSGWTPYRHAKPFKFFT